MMTDTYMGRPSLTTMPDSLLTNDRSSFVSVTSGTVVSFHSILYYLQFEFCCFAWSGYRMRGHREASRKTSVSIVSHPASRISMTPVLYKLYIN